MADDLQAINRNGKLNIKSPVYFLCEIEMFFASTCKCGHATVPYLCVVCIVCSEDGIEAVRKEDVIRCWNFISSFARWKRVLEDDATTLADMHTIAMHQLL